MEVGLIKVRVNNRLQALHALMEKNPQMVCLVRILNIPTIDWYQVLVMTKAAGKSLQADMEKKGILATFFHSGLEPSEKEKIHDLMGTSVVIATTGRQRVLKCLL
jgi:superfamily II DNA helicase RecQ